ncbi:hypothetical protein ALC60_00516 [Trachymyrmex zeteki]|uniref:GIY-YIG domain-containing protein n=1 Tax=Mycetomoellerius zeteki TaxID=64791 RepID=A0A151XJD7_9HYME|nr:hypothetical protein ALC60_00516 [Trachymyrmex zeteki]
MHIQGITEITSINYTVVYKIPCNDYDASYVEQTCRQLKTRISEHKNDINRKKINHTVVTNHRTLHNHDFGWNNVQILDVERNYNKRLISEMINIKRQRTELI